MAKSPGKATPRRPAVPTARSAPETNARALPPSCSAPRRREQARRRSRTGGLGVPAERVIQPDAGDAGVDFRVEEIEAGAGHVGLGVGEGRGGAAAVGEELARDAVGLFGARLLARARLD